MNVSSGGAGRPGGNPKSLKLPPRRLVILATPKALSLEVSGPFEVFSMAERKLREAGRERMAGYAVELLSATDDLTIRSSSGLAVLAQRSWRDIDYEIDTFLVAGSLDVWTGAGQTDFLHWIREKATKARRFGSICTGAFVLAEAGLLSGKRVTTHWSFCHQLQKDYPKVIVDSEPIFVQDGSLYTSAGVTSGIDLALSLVEEDFGMDIALRIARALVLFLRRPAGQNQFSTTLALQGSSRVPLRELPVYILEHLQDPLTVEDMASHVSMSLRNFSRVFVEEFGLTPASFVEKVRMETAKRLVEDGSRSFEVIASECGFGSMATLRRVFIRNFGLTPSQLRKTARK